MLTADPFLDDAALEKLTGRCQKSRQIEWLRAEGIAFRVNATGHPVVMWDAVNGKASAPAQGWQPRAMRA